MKEIFELQEDYEKGKIDEAFYREKRHELERILVEVIDRLAQIGFLSTG